MKSSNICNIKLKSVTKSDCPFLYELLKERKPTVNISHKKIPPYNTHVKFVMSKPYSHWNIIYFKNEKIGSIYLSKLDEIGIFLKQEFKRNGIGSHTLRLFMKKYPRKRYLANISPRNKQSMNFFQKHGFYLIQYTYELIVP
jgi:hypothetical protein